MSITQLQQDILTQLNKTGLAVVDIESFKDQQLQKDYRETQRYFERFAAHPNVGAESMKLQLGATTSSRGKRFELSHYHMLGRPLTLGDSGLFRLYLNEVFLQIAQSYLGTVPRLRNLGSYLHAYVLPSPNSLGLTKAPGVHVREKSQRFHRDTEDWRVLKIFIYFSKVTVDTGPHQYVLRSRYGDKNNHIWPNLDREGDVWNTHGYLDAAAMAKIPPEDIATIVGDRGTVIFEDTNGFHRGGFFTRSGKRLMSVGAYLREDAWQIRHGPLTSLDYDKKRGNFIDTSHYLYDILSPRAKKVVS